MKFDGVSRATGVPRKVMAEWAGAVGGGRGMVNPPLGACFGGLGG